MLENSQLTYEKLLPEPSYGFSLVDFVRVLYKRWPTILSFFLATVATTTLVALLYYSPLYRTEAKLLLEIGKEHVFDPALITTDSARPVIKYNTNQQTAFAREVLLGHYLLDKMVRKLGHNNIYNSEALQADDENNDQEIQIELAVKFLQADIDVSAIPNSSLLNVGIVHEDPNVAAEVVNTLVGMFVNRHMTIRNDDEKRAFYKQQAVALEDKLLTNETALQKLKQENGILSSIPEEKRILVEQQMKLAALRGETVIKMREIEERTTQINAQLENTSDDPQAITSLNQRLTDLQTKESEILANFDRKSSVAINIRNEVSVVKSQIKKLSKGKLYGSKPSSGEPLYARLQETMLQLEVDANALNATEQAQKDQLENYRNKITILDTMEKSLERQEEQILIDQKNYKMFLSKYEQSAISNAMDEGGMSNIKIVEPAYIPIQPMEGKRRMAVLISMLFGLLGGIGLAYLLELLSPTIDTKKDVEQYLGVPVLAVVPETLLPASV